MNPQFKLRDDVLGDISVCVHARARHLILRVLEDGEIRVTVPPRTSEERIRRLIAEHRERVQVRLRERPVRSIDWDFRLVAPHFSLSLLRTDFSYFQLRDDGEAYTLLCPSDTDFTDPQRQAWLRQVVVGVLRKRAQTWLPMRVERFSVACRLPYHTVKINASRGRWGSCSMRKDINLSCFLMLLPEHLADYVILHELCHTVEMNHDVRFWALLDRLCGGHAQALRRELKAFHTGF